MPTNSLTRPLLLAALLATPLVAQAYEITVVRGDDNRKVVYYGTGDVKTHGDAFECHRRFIEWLEDNHGHSNAGIHNADSYGTKHEAAERVLRDSHRNNGYRNIDTGYRCKR